MPPRKFNPVKAERVLEVQRKLKGPPFVSTIADLAEVSSPQLEWWIRYGLELRDNGQEDDPQAIFASTFRRVQAEWIDNATKFVAEAEHAKDRAAAVKNLQWALERLRRDVFDLSRAPKEAPKGDSNKPEHVKRTPQEIADALAKTDLQ